MPLALFLSACREPPGQLTGDRLTQRRAETQALAETLLSRPDLAFLGREEFVIRDERILRPAVVRIMGNLEPWMAGDADRLRFSLEGEVRTASNAIMTSPEGIRALHQLAERAFENPKVTITQGQTPGRAPTELEKRAAETFGALLSGRPAVAQGIPAAQWQEIMADFGLVPAPLELNPPNKHSSTLLRHQRDAAGEWLDAKQPERPSLAVVEKAARRMLQQHPSAHRHVLKMQVLRTLGAPVVWEFLVQKTDTSNEVLLAGMGTAPGYQADFGIHRFILRDVPP